MKYLAVTLLVAGLTTQSYAHDICRTCNRCHACGKTSAAIQAEQQRPGPAAPQPKITTASYTPSQVIAEQQPQQQPQHPPFSNQFQYPRQIDPQLQARAQREARLLAQYSYQENQRRWVSSNGALGHPIGVPAGYVGGTGCSWPEPTGSWRRTTPNTIQTCEPNGPRHRLVAEAVAYNAREGVWYASRIWKPF